MIRVNTSNIRNRRKKKSKIFPWSYTDVYPVVIYYKEKKFKIILTSGLITHNYKWLDKVRPNDIVICLLPYSPSRQDFINEKKHLRDFNISCENIYVLCNTEEQVDMCSQVGFNGWFINHNCLLDENLYRINNSIDKCYDAVLNARPEKWKRHWLASDIGNLALIVGHRFNGKEFINLDEIPHVYENKERLDVNGVCDILNKSKVGLCLSSSEGACYSSSEYLLCGIPVVSTVSMGGRDIWYTEYNSIIVDETSLSVSHAVKELISRDLDPYKIRNEHVRQMKVHRKRFSLMIDDIFKKRNVSLCGIKYFYDNFSHKFVEDYIDTKEAISKLIGKL